ncbi:DNA-binding response regulator [Kineobactrum sediminis]|uniref:DNA-binding response regulator n=1 Tax=Kineobactrum sediminis TaxID=1905677 RepID=A0A2N5Y5X7_9GAMM|nr:response regulator transcription factor [Kineobactrum sediminis]PLW83790.1 DNA-binding response regulator [Kineobactrum sediminis]
MEQLFLASGGKLRARWREAFPAARVFSLIGDIPDEAARLQQVVWLDITGLDVAQRLSRLREVVASGYRVVVMSATPAEAEAFEALNAGAVGYCHVEAAPEQLREVALVVAHGGLWMLPELVQRLMSVSLRVMSRLAPEHPELDALTARELMVAEQVALGASNREIAGTLDITERTVKAHLSVIFEKLHLRDRVQLALVMNNVPTATSVN